MTGSHAQGEEREQEAPEPRADFSLSARALGTIMGVVVTFLAGGGALSLNATHGSLASKIDDEHKEITRAFEDERKAITQSFEKQAEKLDGIKGEVADLRAEVRTTEKTSNDAKVGIDALLTRVGNLEADRAEKRVKLEELERRVSEVEKRK